MCPHCRRTGFLILHGYLYGYGKTDELVKRGHRIFCSNRNNRSGCGKTFCVLDPRVIKNFMICAGFLSAFLDKIRQSSAIEKAFKETGSFMSRSSSYRIYKRLRNCQAHIRSFLIKIKDPPNGDVTNPVFQTIDHLRLVFKHSVVMRFQRYFQTSFL